MKQTWTFDGQLSYDFTFVAPVENQPVAGYSKDAKDVRRVRMGRRPNQRPPRRPTVGSAGLEACLEWHDDYARLQQHLWQDPPKAYGFGGNSTGYPGFLYDSTGRFVYVQLTKKF